MAKGRKPSGKEKQDGASLHCRSVQTGRIEKTLPRPPKVYTIEEKLAAIKLAKKLNSNRAAADKMGMDESNIRRWKKDFCKAAKKPTKKEKKKKNKKEEKKCDAEQTKDEKKTERGVEKKVGQVTVTTQRGARARGRSSMATVNPTGLDASIENDMQLREEGENEKGVEQSVDQVTVTTQRGARARGRSSMATRAAIVEGETMEQAERPAAAATVIPTGLDVTIENNKKLKKEEENDEVVDQSVGQVTITSQRGARPRGRPSLATRREAIVEESSNDDTVDSGETSKVDEESKGKPDSHEESKGKPDSQEGVEQSADQSTVTLQRGSRSRGRPSTATRRAAIVEESSKDVAKELVERGETGEVVENMSNEGDHQEESIAVKRDDEEQMGTHKTAAAVVNPSELDSIENEKQLRKEEDDEEHGSRSSMDLLSNEKKDDNAEEMEPAILLNGNGAHEHVEPSEHDEMEPAEVGEMGEVEVTENNENSSADNQEAEANNDDAGDAAEESDDEDWKGRRFTAEEVRERALDHGANCGDFERLECVGCRHVLPFHSYQALGYHLTLRHACGTPDKPNNGWWNCLLCFEVRPSREKIVCHMHAAHGGVDLDHVEKRVKEYRMNPQARSTRSPSMEPRRRPLEPATSVHAGIEERDRTIVEGDETMDEEHVEEEEKEEVQIEGEGATEDVEEPNYQERSNEEKDETVKEKEKKDEEENRGEGTSATEEEGDIPEMQIQIHDIIVADETEKEEMKGEDKTEQPIPSPVSSGINPPVVPSPASKKDVRRSSEKKDRMEKPEIRKDEGGEESASNLSSTEADPSQSLSLPPSESVRRSRLSKKIDAHESAKETRNAKKGQGDRKPAHFTRGRDSATEVYEEMGEKGEKETEAMMADNNFCKKEEKEDESIDRSVFLASRVQPLVPRLAFKNYFIVEKKSKIVNKVEISKDEGDGKGPTNSGSRELDHAQTTDPLSVSSSKLSRRSRVSKKNDAHEKNKAPEDKDARDEEKEEEPVDLNHRRNKVKEAEEEKEIVEKIDEQAEAMEEQPDKAESASLSSGNDVLKVDGEEKVEEEEQIDTKADEVDETIEDTAEGKPSSRCDTTEKGEEEQGETEEEEAMEETEEGTPALVSSGNDTPEEDGEEKEEKEKQIQSKTVEQKEDMEELAEIEPAPHSSGNNRPKVDGAEKGENREAKSDEIEEAVEDSAEGKPATLSSQNDTPKADEKDEGEKDEQIQSKTVEQKEDVMEREDEESARPSISRSTAETAGEEQKEMEEQRETKIDEHKETGEARVEEEALTGVSNGVVLKPSLKVDGEERNKEKKKKMEDRERAGKDKPRRVSFPDLPPTERTREHEKSAMKRQSLDQGGYGGMRPEIKRSLKEVEIQRKNEQKGWKAQGSSKNRSLVEEEAERRRKRLSKVQAPVPPKLLVVKSKEKLIMEDRMKRLAEEMRGAAMKGRVSDGNPTIHRKSDDTIADEAVTMPSPFSCRDDSPKEAEERSRERKEQTEEEKEERARRRLEVFGPGCLKETQEEMREEETVQPAADSSDGSRHSANEWTERIRKGMMKPLDPKKWERFRNGRRSSSSYTIVECEVMEEMEKEQMEEEARERHWIENKERYEEEERKRKEEEEEERKRKEVEEEIRKKEEEEIRKKKEAKYRENLERSEDSRLLKRVGGSTFALIKEAEKREMEMEESWRKVKYAVSSVDSTRYPMTEEENKQLMDPNLGGILSRLRRSISPSPEPEETQEQRPRVPLPLPPYLQYVLPASLLPTDERLLLEQLESARRISYRMIRLDVSPTEPVPKRLLQWKKWHKDDPRLTHPTSPPLPVNLNRNGVPISIPISATPISAEGSAHRQESHVPLPPPRIPPVVDVKPTLPTRPLQCKKELTDDPRTRKRDQSTSSPLTATPHAVAPPAQGTAHRPELSAPLPPLHNSVCQPYQAVVPTYLDDITSAPHIFPIKSEHPHQPVDGLVAQPNHTPSPLLPSQRTFHINPLVPFHLQVRTLGHCSSLTADPVLQQPYCVDGSIKEEPLSPRPNSPISAPLPTPPPTGHQDVLSAMLRPLVVSKEEEAPKEAKKFIDSLRQDARAKGLRQPDHPAQVKQEEVTDQMEIVRLEEQLLKQLQSLDAVERQKFLDIYGIPSRPSDDSVGSQRKDSREDVDVVSRSDQSRSPANLDEISKGFEEYVRSNSELYPRLNRLFNGGMPGAAVADSRSLLHSLEESCHRSLIDQRFPTDRDYRSSSFSLKPQAYRSMTESSNSAAEYPTDSFESGMDWSGRGDSRSRDAAAQLPLVNTPSTSKSYDWSQQYEEEGSRPNSPVDRRQRGHRYSSKDYYRSDSRWNRNEYERRERRHSRSRSPIGYEENERRRDSARHRMSFYECDRTSFRTHIPVDVRYGMDTQAGLTTSSPHSSGNSAQFGSTRSFHYERSISNDSASSSPKTSHSSSAHSSYSMSELASFPFSSSQAAILGHDGNGNPIYASCNAAAESFKQRDEDQVASAFSNTQSLLHYPTYNWGANDYPSSSASIAPINNDEEDIDGIPIPSPTKEQRMKEDKQQELIRRMHNSRRQNNQ